MNIRLITYMLGQVIRATGAVMVIPVCCSIWYREDTWYALVFPMLFMLLFGTVLTHYRPADGEGMQARDGLVAVGLAWIVLSLLGMLPFILSGDLIHPADAFFETVSGFTTTGATVMGEAVGVNPADLDRGIAMWRSLTHWIGGMGVLVFVMAVMPKQDFKSTRLMHAMRAEVPGPVATKVVPTLRHSARIMYGIYIAMTVLMVVFLLAGGMSLYDAVLHSLSTAGTGGFSNMNASIGAYDSSYIHWVITIFMLLFSINFNLYYLIITGHVLQALRCEEMRWFLIVVGGVTAIITLNISSLYDHVGIALRDAAFQVAAFISTTGFNTANYDHWPALSQGLLVLLMFIGGCAGSTAGGIKVSRLVILIRSAGREVRNILFPREVRCVRAEERAVDEDTVRGANAYIVLYLLFFVAGVLLLLGDGLDLVTSFTAVTSCINNVGPGFGTLIGATAGSSFGVFSPWVKILLSFIMLLGRLELFPILMLFYPASRRGKMKKLIKNS
ncbi:MAG: TrkH family potassium uptake protein [Clostridia bacterium]|nr:TrkH family potassium uptake protein [Clostridia bacterium]